MRTNIVGDDTLMAETLEFSGYKTKKETVEEALNLKNNTCHKCKKKLYYCN